jgi:exodeoxyribonuclease V gamma subunit
MQPMRNIPFPVICVLGMQDNAFPRREHSAEFDLMRQQWRPGDPHKGDEDRYLMLETLLCARRYLYFSYCGRSLRDNSECQPSVLLRELLDYIDSCFGAADDGPRVSQQISRVHPMQPFSSKNFQPEVPGFDRYWYETSIQLESGRPLSQASSWPREKLAPITDSDNEIDLAALLRFFAHPIRYFFNSRLGVRIPVQSTSTDEENFTLQGLQKWQLGERLAENFLCGSQNDAQQFSAEGLLPHGRAASSGWLSLQSEYQTLLDQLGRFRHLPSTSRTIECSLENGLLLYGEVGACYADLGLMHFSASKTVSSRALLSLWLSHLALCATQQLTGNEISQLIIPAGKGKRFEFLDADSARALLANYIRLFQQGMDYPLPVFPNTSYAWASYADPEVAMNKALAAWNGGNFRNSPRGEREDEFIRLALHNCAPNPLAETMFQECARQIYSPAIEHGGDSD